MKKNGAEIHNFFLGFLGGMYGEKGTFRELFTSK